MVARRLQRVALTLLCALACCMLLARPVRADIPDVFPVIWEEDYHEYSDGTQEWLTEDGWTTENPELEGQPKGDGSDQDLGTDKVTGPVAPQEGDEGEEDSQPTNVPTHKGLSPMLLVTIVAIVAAVVATVGIVLLSRARRSTVTVKPSHLRKP